MKLKIKLLLAAFIFIFLGVIVTPIKINAEENEKTYYSFVSTEYKEVTYKLTDYPEYEKYNIKDTEFLNKERVAKIPYRVLNIASGAFSKDLDIDDVKVEYKRSKLDLEGILSETEDASISLKRDNKSKLQTYQVSKEDIEKTLNEVDKDIKRKAELLYKAFNHIMLENNYKFETDKISKEKIVDEAGKQDIMNSQSNEFAREDKRLNGALHPKYDLGGDLTKNGRFKVFGNNYFYFKFYLGSALDITSKGYHFSELKISEHKLLNPILNEKHDLTNLWQFPTKYAHIRVGYGFYLKDELKEEIQEMNRQYLASKPSSTEKGNSKNTTLKIALAVGIPALLIVILTPIIIVSIKKRKQSQN